MNKGFTLIELLVVVLIISVLAAVALPQYQKAVEKSRLSEALVTVANIQKGVDFWLLENGYPNQVMNLVGAFRDEPNSGEAVNLPVDGYCSEESREVIRKVRVGTKWRMVTYTEGVCRSGSYTYSAECRQDHRCIISAQRHIDPFEGDARWDLLLVKQGNGGWEKLYIDNEDSSVSHSIMDSLESQGWSEEEVEP